MRGRRDPVGSRTKPVFSYSSTADSIIAKHPSVIEAWTTCPGAPLASFASARSALGARFDSRDRLLSVARMTGDGAAAARGNDLPPAPAQRSRMC